MSDSARHARLKEIFHAALEQPKAGRAAFLAQACGDDAALRSEVELLLAAATDDTFLSPPTAPRLPDDIGQERGYRVLRELDRGGMGVVLLAERTDGAYAQQVAIKLLGTAFASAESVLRFRLERQILARLAHPHIARLLDGGTARDGTPYLVMEFVEGERIDRWCETRALPLPARLRLFDKVAAAVDYAHRNLVVHRDLKPANILVTAQGEPKLLDFGIAKLLGAEGEFSGLTGDGSRLLTPRYASPEQLRGEAVTTASDVYALGVLLYELIAGASPYGEALGTPEALGHAILESDPPPPSRVTADATGIDADLDAIVLACLRKAPAERYASVEALRADLARRDAGVPVLARRGGWSYRARKFARRHWAALAATAAMLLLVAGFVLELRRQLQRTAIERDKAEQVAGFLTELFRVADPSESRGNSITAREILDRGAARLHDGASLPAEVQGAVAGTMGTVYQRLGLFAPAETLLQQSREVAARGGDALAADAALASLRLDQGKFAEAQALLAPALDAHRRARAPDRLRARLTRDLGLALLRQGKRDAAAPLLEESLALCEQTFGATSREVVEALSALAFLRRDQNDGAGAVAAYRRALDVAATLPQRDPWLEARLRNNFGLLLNDRGEWAAAENEIAAAQAGMESVLGARHPLLATAALNHASLLNRLGRCAEAAVQYEHALTLRTELFGADDVQTATALAGRGYNRLCLDELAAAAADLQAALPKQAAKLGVKHLYTLTSQRNLAAVEFTRGDLAAARARYAEAIATGRAALGEDNALVLAARARAALVDGLDGKPVDTELAAVEAAQAKTLGATHPDTAETRLIRATLAAGGGDCAALDAVATQFAGMLPPTHHDRRWAGAVALRCRVVAGGEDAASLAAAREALVPHYGSSHPLLAQLVATPAD